MKPDLMTRSRSFEKNPDSLYFLTRKASSIYSIEENYIWINLNLTFGKVITYLHIDNAFMRFYHHILSIFIY